MNLPEGDPRHGTNGYANLGCRCTICTDANTARQHIYMHQNPLQQYKNRNRGRKVRGLSEAQCMELEMKYQMRNQREGRA